MKKDIPVADVLCYRTHDGIALFERKHSLILDRNVNVSNVGAHIAGCGLRKRNDSGDPTGVCLPKTLRVKQTAEEEPLPDSSDVYQDRPI
jgi:hypothetical protein